MNLNIHLIDEENKSANITNTVSGLKVVFFQYQNEKANALLNCTDKETQYYLELQNAYNLMNKINIENSELTDQVKIKVEYQIDSLTHKA